MLPLLKELVVTVGRAAVEALAKAILSKVEQSDETPSDVAPLPYKSIEHQRRQERDSIAASKAAQR